MEGRPVTSRTANSTRVSNDALSGQSAINLAAQLASTPAAMAKEDDAPHPTLSRDAEAWSAIVEKIRLIYELSNLRLTSGPSYLKRVDRSFAFSAAPGDDLHRSLHVEPLLDEAANLLDRALSDRQMRDSLAVEATNLGLQFEEFLRLDAIHAREIAAGFYELPYQRTKAEASAEAAAQASSTAAKRHIDNLVNAVYTVDKTQSFYGALQLAGWVGGGPWLSEGTADDKFNYIWNGVDKDKLDHLYDAAVVTGLQAALTPHFSYRAQLELHDGAARTSDRRRAAIELQSRWHQQDAGFRLARTQASRDVMDLRMMAASLAGAPLNYPERIKPIEANIHQDLRNALARISAASRGLQDVYGYDDVSPPTDVVASRPETSQLDEAVAWTRRAINWLTRFSKLDQNYVMPFSIREGVGRHDWIRGRRSLRWVFSIPEAAFPAQCHVRLRGCSVTVRGFRVGGLWSASVRVPGAGTVLHLNGERTTLEQQFVPTLRLARVRRRSVIGNADIGGVMATHNASPIGEWIIEMRPPKAALPWLSCLTDVVLDLHLAVRAYPGPMRSSSHDG